MAMYRLYPMIEALNKCRIPVVSILDTPYVYDGYSWHRLPTEDYDDTMESVIEALEEKIQEIVSHQVEYEEEHQDAGDNYAFLVRECYCGDVPMEFVEYLEAQYKDLDVVDITEIYERIIFTDLYEMRRGSMYGPYEKDCVSISGYPVEEIECQINPNELEIDLGEDWHKHIALAWIRSHSNEVCINYDCGKFQVNRFFHDDIHPNIPLWRERYRDILAYECSSAVWCAVVSHETIKDEVKEHLES